VVRKRGELWREGALILRHDNTPAYSSLRVSQFLAEKGISALDHPSSSSDMVPADFCLFPELKGVLKGKRFSDVEQIKSVKKKFNKHLCSDLKTFEQWSKLWEHCKELEGDYFKQILGC
jgi:hypothetical protein